MIRPWHEHQPANPLAAPQQPAEIERASEVDRIRRANAQRWIVKNRASVTVDHLLARVAEIGEDAAAAEALATPTPDDDRPTLAQGYTRPHRAVIPREPSRPGDPADPNRSVHASSLSANAADESRSRRTKR